MQNANLVTGVLDVLELKLSGVTGTAVPLIDIYLNDELYKEDVSVTSKSLLGESSTISLEGHFSDLQSLRIQFKNDAGIERVDIHSLTFNGNTIDLSQGSMVRDNGDVHDGLTKMYWNGSFVLDADALNAQEYAYHAVEPEPAPAPEPISVTQTVEIDLSAIRSGNVPEANIYINGELVEANHQVEAQLINGESETLSFKVDGEKVSSVQVEFLNDSGSSRIDLLQVRVNNNVVNLKDSQMVRENGDIHDGLTKMYWDGKVTVSVPDEYNNMTAEPAPTPEEPVETPQEDTPDTGTDTPIEEPPVEEEPAAEPVSATQAVEIDLTAIRSGDVPEANIYINGELVEANHQVEAQLIKGETETLSFKVEGEKVSSVQVEFINDSGSSRIDLLQVRVNNNEVNLEDSQLTRENGDVHEGLTKIYWNGKVSVSVPDEYNNMTAEPAPAPEEPAETPQEDTPDTGTDTPSEEQPAEENPGSETPVNSDSDWGGIDPNMYRGEYAGRDRATTETATGGEVLHIEAGTSASAIMKMIANADPNAHLTLDFAAGEHWFNEQLLIERGDITVKGAGEGKTVFVANFANFDVQNLIQIQGDDIRLDNGSNNGRWREDQSDYVGTATKHFSLGDRELTVSSTNGLSVGDHVMVYKEGTYSKTDGDDEFGTIAEITGISGNNLTFKHSLAFGSDMLASGEGLSSVKVYEMDLLENVNIHDFSIRYHVTEKDVYNPYKMPLEDILNTTEFNYFPKYAVGGKSVGEVGYGNQRAMVLSGTHEANIHNVTMEDVGSHAFFFSGNLELYADSLTVDGVYNKGVDGNGYGIEYDKTYYSDFTNLDITNVRHGVSANILGGNGFNNFHVKHTDSNLDFHGGRDQANIYYVENMDYKAHWLPKIINGKLSGDINYGYGKSQFELINYRQDANIAENTVIWKNAIANGSPNNDGSIYDESGEKLSVSLHANDDFLVAGNLGSNINAGFGNDILVAGKGNDVLTGGKNAGGFVQKDMFVFDTKSGQDVVTDFEAGNDKVLIAAAGSSLNSVSDVLKFVSQSGSDAVLDFGNGNTVTFMHTDVEDFNSGNVQLLSDVTDLM